VNPETHSASPNIPVHRLLLMAFAVVFSFQASAEAEEGSAPAPEPMLTASGDADTSPVTTDRIAVLVLSTDEENQELADNLTEVLIAAVADHTTAQIVGKEEFQAILQRQDEASLDCLESLVCLGRVGAELGVTEVIAGTLGRREGQFTYHVGRTSIETGELMNLPTGAA
jgi:hypothetical protein